MRKKIKKKSKKKSEKYEKSEKKWEMKNMKVVVLLNKSYVCINKLLAREVHVISD